MAKLAGKNVLISGGSNGIGAGIALKFAEEGASVAITYLIDKENAEALVKKITSLGNKTKAIAIQADVSSSEDRKKILEETLSAFGTIDILVNNAGILIPSSIKETTEIKLEKTLQVNFKGPFFLTRAVADIMQKTGKGGNIILISSISDEVVIPNFVAYQCSKAALTMFAKSAAMEYVQSNIRVNYIRPGRIKTNMNRILWENNPDFWQEKMAEIPMEKAGHCEDIANAALYLASDDSSYVTGTGITVDGGRSLSISIVPAKL